MAMNTPTIAFWNCKHWAMCEEAEKIYSKLRDVGILHNKPESAAQMIEDKWGDMKKWWNSEDIQNVRLNFCKHYALFSKNWKNEWYGFLSETNMAKY